MKRTHVVFNGFELSRTCIISNLRNPLLPRAINSREVAGIDGSVFTGASLLPRTITLQMTIRGKTLDDRQAAARLLAAVLAVDEPAPLSLSIDNGLYYMAVPKSDGDIARFVNADTFDVEFICHDPVAFGAQKTITVPSGEAVTFEVGGTYQAMPVITAEEAANGSGGFWRLRLEDGSFFIATIPDGVTSAPVVADCKARTLYVNDNVTLLDPDADWLVLDPGEHTVTMDGTGDASISYVERWL